MWDFLRASCCRTCKRGLALSKIWTDEFAPHLRSADAAPHLTQAELSRRWRKSERTIESWRWKKTGPRYLKIGGRVIYRLEDIEAFELAAMFEPKG